MGLLKELLMERGVFFGFGEIECLVGIRLIVIQFTFDKWARPLAIFVIHFNPCNEPVPFITKGVSHKVIGRIKGAWVLADCKRFMRGLAVSCDFSEAFPLETLDGLES